MMHLLKLLSHSLGRKVWGMDLRWELAWSEMLHTAAHPAPSGSYSAILAVAFFLSTTLLRWFTIPKNHHMSPTLPGDFTFCIVATFSGLGQIPFWSTTYPKNFLWLWKLTFLSIRCQSSFFQSLEYFCQTIIVFLHCMFLYQDMSPIIQTTPSKPLNRSDIRHWKCSGVEVIPNGNHRKQYRPNRVMKIVSSALSGDRGICQNPVFMSNFERILAPSNWANVCSTAGSGSLLANTLVESCQVNANPELVCFCTTTIPEHRSVSSLTRTITPNCFILSISSFTCFIRGKQLNVGLSEQRVLLPYGVW